MTPLSRLFRSEGPKARRPLRSVIGYLMQRAAVFESVNIRRDRYVLPFFSGSNMALTYWAVPHWSDPTENFVRRFLRQDGVMVDVGANVGTVSAAAAVAVGPRGKVFALEPHPRTYGYLRRTMSANGFEQVACFNVACGDAAGTAVLRDRGRKDDVYRISPTGGGAQVAIVRLCDFLSLFSGSLRVSGRDPIFRTCTNYTILA